MTLNYKHLAFFLFVFTGSIAQVGIGTTTPEGALDVSSNNSGVVVPRVALTSKTDLITVVNPQGGNVVNGTLVWNTTTAGVIPNDVAPGFYYYTHPTWTALGGDTTRQWSLSGNTGTTPGTDFLGTTDAVDWRIKTNNLDRFTFANNGSLRSHYLGAAGTPAYSFNGDPNTGIFSTNPDILGFSTGGNERFRIPNAFQVHAMNPGSAGAPFYSFGADPNTGIFGIATGDFLGFSTAGTERMRILANGNVSINNTAPAAGDKFTVTAPVNNWAVNGYSSGTGGGVFGRHTSTAGVGVLGINTQLNGTALAGSSDAGDGYSVFPLGSGVAGEGRRIGVYGIASNADWTLDAFGGLFENDGAFAFVGGWDPLTNRKIIGNGSVSTIVTGVDGTMLTMTCPESPEIIFQDYGIGNLVNGYAKIEIDPNFSKNIRVDDSHPLKVFVQLEGDCNGVYVTGKSAEGFEVKELQNGSSNVSFSWSIVATRADEKIEREDGTFRISQNGLRFQPAPALPKKAQIPIKPE